MSEIELPRMLTPDKCAKETGFPAKRIRALAKAGKIVFVPCGKKKILINLQKFIEFINNNTEYIDFGEDEQPSEYYGGVKPINV